MFKKLMIASVLLASSSAFAINGAPYIGAGFGVNQQLFEDETNGATIDFGGTGALFNASLGYGTLVMPKVYLGGELLANVATADVQGEKLNDDSLTLKFKTKYSYGLSLIPGIMLTDNTMGYARVGIVRTRFDVKQTTHVDPTDIFQDGSDQNTVTGGQFGLGVQTKLTNNFDLRGEYVYNTYHSFNTMDNKIDPSSGYATVGFVYKFQ